jgi:predicted ester cyclase
MDSHVSLEENKRLIQRLIDEGHNRQDAAAAAAFYTEDASNHLRIVGRAGMKAVFETLYTVFPDFHYEILESTAEADRVVCKMTMSGTHRGQPELPEAFSGMLNGVVPKGKPVKVLQFHSFRIRDGLICEHAAVRDDMGLVLQLGLVQKPN